MSDSGGGGGVGVGVQVSCGGLGPYISRLVVCTIAASCVLGLFYPTWRVVQDVDELHSPPYDPRIVTAVKYSFTAAAFNLPWGFLFCLFALLMTVDIGRGSVAFLTTFFLGAIDVVSLSFIAAATTWHWKLLGKPFKSCGEADRPYGDGTPSFFTIVGARVDKSAEGVCKDLSKAVVAEIVLMVILFTGVSLLLSAFCQAFCVIPMLLAAAGRAISRACSSLMRRIRGYFRFVVGYLGKLAQRRSTFRTRLTFKLGGQSKVGDVEMNTMSTPLTEMVGIQSDKDVPILPQDLHFADVVSLSMVKALRGTSVQDGGLDPERLRRDTCLNGSKSDCWACGNQICRGCTHVRNIANPETAKHVEHCITVCSSCYYKHCCNLSKPQEPLTAQKCNHNLETKDLRLLPRTLCSLCSKRTADEIRLSRQQKEADELKQLESATAFCAVCESRLPEGSPRWWACSVCKIECKSRLHTQWVAKHRQ